MRQLRRGAGNGPHWPCRPLDAFGCRRTLRVNQERVNVGPVHWAIRTSDRGDNFSVRGKRGEWTVDSAGAGDPDLKLIASRRSLAEYLTTPPAMRGAKPPGMELNSNEAEIGRFLDAIAVFPQLQQT
jgi:hypothetical protein